MTAMPPAMSIDCPPGYVKGNEEMTKCRKRDDVCAVVAYALVSVVLGVGKL